MKLKYLVVSIILLTTISHTNLQAQNDVDLNSWAYDSIHIPKSKLSSLENKAVVVAVIDNAFNFSHNDLKGFLYKNPLEVANNQLDDDGNNYVDDISGWDISDNDNNVSVIKGREKQFYHGTYVTSIITKIASLHYGIQAKERIKIMPIKVLSDHANRGYFKDGYRGIKYAMDNGADIICLAWSGGNPSQDELRIIKEAYKKGILIIGSAGNFNEEKILYPALIPEVLTVTASNKYKGKFEKSNYGMEADISAPGELVVGAHPEKNNAYIHENGTSASAAIVAGCAAIIKSKNIDFTNVDLKEILLNSCTPFDKNFATYGGKMGSGIVNLITALDYAENFSTRKDHYSALRSKGYIHIDATNSNKSFEIDPAGNYFGFFVEPNLSGIKKPEKHSIDILVNDTLWANYNLSSIPQNLFVPSAGLKVKLNSNSLKKKDFLKIHYYGKTIDSTTLYCSGLKYLGLDTGSLTDGSGENNYVNNSACRWLITVPDGKRVKFTFNKMDTEANVDFVYLVDGRTVIPENYIALFSGQILPPVVTSQTNEVLIWFVTDKTRTGKGWSLQYEAIK